MSRRVDETQAVDEIVRASLSSPANNTDSKTLDVSNFLAIRISSSYGLAGLRVLLQTRIEAVYGLNQGVAREVAQRSAAQVHSAFESSLWHNEKVHLRQSLLISFAEMDYLGDADERFIRYLQRCWAVYQQGREVHLAPCTTVVQSSGFGKSRLLYQLARRTIDREELGMRVLYICTRMHKSSGFPEATVNLRSMLFDSGQTQQKLSHQLEAIYHHAQQNWSTVGYEWIELFTNPFADAPTEGTLDGVKAAKSGAGGRVVVLALDEVSALLTVENGGIDLLQGALIAANKSIRASFPGGGILAVLVDTNPEITGLRLPPPPLDTRKASDFLIFPPFVLADTMDVFWRDYCSKLGMDEISAYKFVVTQGNKNEAVKALVAMGRPLWASFFHALIQEDRTSGMGRWELVGASGVFDEMVRLASSKLMVGLAPLIPASYNEDTMFGIASLLCRLGLRPRFTSSLASRVVERFMAVLAYVSRDYDGLVSAYTSDPVLALGATHLWHVWGAFDEKSSLSECILPQLKNLLVQEVLDVDNADELVARVVLLLAVDLCVVVEAEAQYHSQCHCEGQHVSVGTFMTVLGGSDPPVLTTDLTSLIDANTKTAFETWKSRWAGWKMGFSHFIQLTLEPTEQTLWFLLGRHAAGVLSRDLEEACLILPIFRGESEVTFILVQATDCVESGRKLMGSADTNLLGFLSDDNPLRASILHDVLYVRMTPGETVPQCDPDRYFVAEGGATRNMKTPVFSLRVRSVSTWKFSIGTHTYQVMKESEASELVKLASFVRTPMALIRSAVDSDGKSGMTSKTETISVAGSALVNAPNDGDLGEHVVASEEERSDEE